MGRPRALSKCGLEVGDDVDGAACQTKISGALGISDRRCLVMSSKRLGGGSELGELELSSTFEHAESPFADDEEGALKVRRAGGDVPKRTFTPPTPAARIRRAGDQAHY